ncbi:MAG: RDD family protein [Rhodospirillaceae bacterium]|nr:RDD family protein [Rhodospirillaceae bacterium]
MAEQKLPAIQLESLGRDESGSVHDPLLHPELYEGVAARRVLAFLVDMLIVGTVLGVAWTAAFVLLVVSFGLIALPMVLGSIAFVILYDVLTIGGPSAGTPGMQVFGLKAINWTGGRPDNVQALLLSVLFWAISSWSLLPLAVALFNPRWRCVHDFLSGMVIVRRIPGNSAA